MKRQLEVSHISKEDSVRLILSAIGLFKYSCSAYSRWLSLVGKRYVVAPVLLVVASIVSCLVTGVDLYTAVPQALGMGQAYTARARGPLSPLWNPAAISDLPGLHGALAVSFSSEAEGALLAGGSLVGSEGLSVGLAMAQGKDAGQGFGTLAFRILPGISIGGSLASVAQTDSRGISFNAGVLVRGTAWSLGAGLYHLDAGILGTDLPLRIHVGASVEVVPGSCLAVDLHLEAGNGEVALGVQTKVWAFDLHWGAAISLDGGLSHAGLGVGFVLFDLPADLSIGLVGADQQLWISGGVEGTIPLW